MLRLRLIHPLSDNASLAEENKRLIAEMKRMKEEHQQAIASKDAEMECMKEEHQQAIASKDAEMECMKVEHQQAIVWKDYTIEKLIEEIKRLRRGMPMQLPHSESLYELSSRSPNPLAFRRAGDARRQDAAPGSGYPLHGPSKRSDEVPPPQPDGKSTRSSKINS